MGAAIRFELAQVRDSHSLREFSKDCEMTDITEYVDRYRLTLRHIWNSCFYIDPALRNWESVYSFRELKQPLFDCLVADNIDMERRNEVFGRGFRVVPLGYDGTELPSLQVNRRIPSSASGGTWDLLKGPFKAADIQMTLVDLFDWAPLSYLDLRYYVVIIDSFQAHPDAVGQHALVDTRDVKVFWDQDAQ
jgi:hypothetical protein